MLTILRNLDKCNWLYVHDQLKLTKIGNIQRIDETWVNEKMKIACRYGYNDLAELMIGKGANHFNLGLYNACMGGHLEIAKLMIDRGANDFNNGLYEACYNGHLKIVELMIQKEANDFDEAIEIAREYNHQNIIDFLTNHSV